MSAFSGSALFRCALVGTFLVASLGVAAVQPAPAQTRTLAGRVDVPALVPAPYHPNAITATYSASLYYGGVYSTGGPHYWH
jgi:hypothetical protein